MAERDATAEAAGREALIVTCVHVDDVCVVCSGLCASRTVRNAILGRRAPRSLDVDVRPWCAVPQAMWARRHRHLVRDARLDLGVLGATSDLIEPRIAWVASAVGCAASALAPRRLLLTASSRDDEGSGGRCHWPAPLDANVVCALMNGLAYHGSTVQVVWPEDRRLAAADDSDWPIDAYAEAWDVATDHGRVDGIRHLGVDLDGSRDDPIRQLPRFRSLRSLHARWVGGGPYDAEVMDRMARWWTSVVVSCRTTTLVIDDDWSGPLMTTLASVDTTDIDVGVHITTLLLERPALTAVPSALRAGLTTVGLYQENPEESSVAFWTSLCACPRLRTVLWGGYDDFAYDDDAPAATESAEIDAAFGRLENLEEIVIDDVADAEDLARTAVRNRAAGRWPRLRTITVDNEEQRAEAMAVLGQQQVVDGGAAVIDVRVQDFDRRWRSTWLS